MLDPYVSFVMGHGIFYSFYATEYFEYNEAKYIGQIISFQKSAIYYPKMVGQP